MDTTGDIMESISLTDTDRYNAIGIDLTFSMNGNGTRLWVFTSSCAYKFIVVGDILVIGPIRSPIGLYIAAATWSDTIEDAKVKAISMARHWHGDVTAAGEVDENGEVTGWKSGGFKVETPEDKRPNIAATIRRLYQSGGLIIQ